MSIRPLPPEMEDFLEVDDHYLPTEMKDDGTISQALNNESTIRLKKSIVSSENLDKESFHGKRIPNDNILPTSFSASLISNEDKIREKIKKQMFFVIMSSYIASTLFYAFLIYTSFVDITSTTTGLLF